MLIIWPIELFCKTIFIKRNIPHNMYHGTWATLEYWNILTFCTAVMRSSSLWYSLGMIPYLLNEPTTFPNRIPQALKALKSWVIYVQAIWYAGLLDLTLHSRTKFGYDLGSDVNPLNSDGSSYRPGQVKLSNVIWSLVVSV